MPETVQNLLAETVARLRATSATAWLDAEVLLCHCLDKNRSFLRAWPEHHLTDKQLQLYLNLVAQREQGVPVAYLTGQREFWSRNFKVNANVLIPRPDSELLIELSLALLPTKQTCKILDLGTGSGVLAVTLAAERPLAKVLATDISPAALQVAESNAQFHMTANVRFLVSDWFAAVTDTDFDLIISNPPYIAANDPHLQQGDLRFEPPQALCSSENGLQAIRLLAEQAAKRLKAHAHLMVEHGYNQQNEVTAIFATLNYQNITTHTDLSGQPRVTSAMWNPL